MTYCKILWSGMYEVVLNLQNKHFHYLPFLLIYFCSESIKFLQVSVPYFSDADIVKKFLFLKSWYHDYAQQN